MTQVNNALDSNCQLSTVRTGGDVDGHPLGRPGARQRISRPDAVNGLPLMIRPCWPCPGLRPCHLVRPTTHILGRLTTY